MMDWDVFSMDGRLRRSHYLVYLIAVLIVAGLAYETAKLVCDDVSATVAGGLILIAQGWSNWCLAVRRAHDAGWSAFFVALMTGLSVLSAIALVTGIILFAMLHPAGWTMMVIAGVFALVSGTMGLALLVWPPDGDNDWGADPR